MRIDPQQFDRLLQQDKPAFVEKIRAELRSQHPEFRQSDDMMRDSIRAGLKRARAHGLHSDEQLMDYVLVMFASAPNFDQHPHIADMLSSPGLSPSARWECIFETDFDDAWEEVADIDFYDGDFWIDPDELAARAAEPDDDGAEVSDDDWAELVIALKQAQGPGPYPAATPDELSQAKQDLDAALDRRRTRTPEDWESEARAMAEKLRQANASDNF